MIDRSSGFVKVLGQHRRGRLNAGVERQEPWLSDARNFRCIIDVDDQDASAPATLRNEIGGLWLLLFEDFLNYFQAILFYRSIARFYRE